MSDAIDVLVAGEYYCDLIFSGLDAPPALGGEVFAGGLTVRPGGCYNMALALTRLGLRTAWACDFGTDLFSHLVLDAAKADGIDAGGFRYRSESLRQVSAAFSAESERGFITYREAPLRAPGIDLAARLAPKWVLQTFRLEPDWLAFMRAAKTAGAKIFGDCNGEGATLDTPGVGEFIALCDVFSPNEAEALTLTEARDAEAALTRLASIAPLVVVKRGPLGATAVAASRRYDVPAPAVRVIDTVGAGDAFAAGFLAAALADAPIEDCLQSAIACGTLSATGAGNSANPSATELEAFVALSFHHQARAASA